jgi:hypothetical protein
LRRRRTLVIKPGEAEPGCFTAAMIEAWTLFQNIEITQVGLGEAKYLTLHPGSPMWAKHRIGPK